MTNNSKHGGERERALEDVTGLAEHYVWKNHGNGARTTLGHATRQHVREAFTAGYEAALTQPPAVEALQWQPIETMPRNREVEVWSKYRQHMGVATFKDNEVVPDTLIYWREHVPPKAIA